MLEAQAEKTRFANMVRNELEWQNHLATSPRPTGSFLRATLYSKPMIRLKPQPIHVSGMINRRLRSRERRQDQLDVVHAALEALHATLRVQEQHAWWHDTWPTVVRLCDVHASMTLSDLCFLVGCCTCCLYIVHARTRMLTQCFMPYTSALRMDFTLLTLCRCRICTAL